MELKELIAILDRNRINRAGWFKSVDDLLEEIRTGESSVDNNGVNHLEIVNCEITDERGYRLLESRQLYNDGRDIQRMIKVSGKMRRYESPLNAMQRELSEELGIDADSYRLVDLGSTVRENNNRPFFATLPSRCVRHHFKLEMPYALWQEVYIERTPERTAWFTWFPPE